MLVAKLLEVIRRAIEASGKTRYRIAQDTGILQSHLSRLMRGDAGLSVDSVERLADYLGLEITIRPKRGRSRKGR